MKEKKYNDLFTKKKRKKSGRKYQVQFRPFAVGSVTGFLDDIDKDAIKTLHQFCKEDIELDQFLSDIQSTASLEFNKLLDMILEEKEEQETKTKKGNKRKLQEEKLEDGVERKKMKNEVVKEEGEREAEKTKGKKRKVAEEKKKK